ncbi:hypothetical protein V6N13_041652 [Hibiscus sabdariffa]
MAGWSNPGMGGSQGFEEEIVLESMTLRDKGLWCKVRSVNALVVNSITLDQILMVEAERGKEATMNLGQLVGVETVGRGEDIIKDISWIIADRVKVTSMLFVVPSKGQAAARLVKLMRWRMPQPSVHSVAEPCGI